MKVNESVVNRGLSYVIYYSNLFDSKSLHLGVCNRGIHYMKSGQSGHPGTK